MLPAQFGGRTLTALSIGGSPVGFSTQLMKGITYAVFSAQPGAYQATYTAPGGSTPAITAQPASAWTTSGQTATFSVQAAGTALTYQWQSMPNGATGFTSIPGAVSSTYTTSVLGSSDSGTQFQCVISNASGSVVSKAATVTVLPPGVNFVTNYSPGTVRNNFTGWVGMSITVGSTPITVNALGRVFVAGNGGSHTLKIVDASTGLDLPNASVGANMALPSTPGPIYYFPLTAPVTLNANGKYYVVSQEVSGGDQWYDVSTVIQTTNAAAVQGGVYGLPYTLSHSAGSFSYGPVDFQYKAAVSGPTILQQAQSLTVVSGQSATFSIVASGSGLVYQWQTAPAGSSTFSNISGATASTYTIPVTSLSQTGSQFLCMVSNGAGTSTSQTATLTVIPPVTGMGLVTSEVLGTIRNNYSGWVGMVIQVGSTPLTINALGRFAAAGNSGTHSVKIVNAATGGDIPGASATVSMTGVPAGTFAYGNLSTPVTLSSNATYYVLTQETSGGDTWYDYNTTVQTNSAASVGGAVYNTSGGYTVTGSAAHSYGPVDIIYTISTSAPAFFVTATYTGTVRNNFTGWVGASVTIGAQPVAVTQLGRFCLNGNGGTHTVKLVNAASGLDVPGGSAVVNMAGGAAGFFVYAPLA
ncbi:MAG: immunoglobulin domain-containing protein, partial [Acidobacteriia bacterium]|nr:immunoglobulin domain-containing protein [Terriglobia bacterium]